MAERTDRIRLFLCGDVMTGRGIDQILPHPGDPHLYERASSSATLYVELAEAVNGPIPYPVTYSYIWGDALEILEEKEPDLRIINLETAITSSMEYWPGKGINYRMSPENAPCLASADIDICALANNHVIDWGYSGLEDTLETLKNLGIASAGAGKNSAEAEEPAILKGERGGRVILFSLGMGSSGIPSEWRAERDRPGVFRINLFSAKEALASIRRRVERIKRPGDIAVASIHWGKNWGYQVQRSHRGFACSLIDEAGIDLVHGHSSHHPKGIEVYQGHLILYGCGDFINDYEGISGYEEYRSELSLMYFPELDRSSGVLKSLTMVPTRMRRFQVKRASPEETEWLVSLFRRIGKVWQTDVALQEKGYLSLQWKE